MKLYSLMCILEEDKCKFQTQQLEFSKAKEILEMHMMLVHGQRYRCNSCDRDTCDKDNKDIIEDDIEALCTKDDEADCDVLEEPSEIDDPTSVRNPTKQNEASIHPNIADVTSVRDDCEHDCQHFEEDQQFEKGQTAIEAENNVVKEIFKPVGILLSSSLCKNCGQTGHTSERKVRRRRCSAWNHYCEICGRRGH